MKNHIGRPFLLLVITVGILLVLRMFTLPKWGDFEMKPINLLSDIMERDTTDKVAKALAHLPKIKPIEIDSCPPGIECIEDYADSTQRGMSAFYKALCRADSMKRPIRIAYFGDSFIEGDIVTADLREMLQDKFGGMGAGFTDMAPPFAGFRISLPQFSYGWDVRNILQGDSCEQRRLGLTQRYSIPLDSAYTEIRGTQQYAHLDSFEVATLYISSPHPVNIKVRKNYNRADSVTTEGNGNIEAVCSSGHLKRIRWNVEEDSLTTCYGVAIEGRDGITLDNFSFRGSGGTSLGNIPQHIWNNFAEVRPYDLIILHFGLNVASKEQLEYGYYVDGLSRVIRKMKKAYPYAGLLIISVSDREDKIDGSLQTIPGVKALIKYQQQTAALNHIAFWNLYKAMGGEGSIVRMSDAKPRAARKDYTHITRHGGKIIAEKLYKALLYGYDKYRNKEKDK